LLEYLGKKKRVFNNQRGNNGRRKIILLFQRKRFQTFRRTCKRVVAEISHVQKRKGLLKIFDVSEKEKKKGTNSLSEGRKKFPPLSLKKGKKGKSSA